ncbi:hypothetical protein H5410_015444 [Solanum commersonii]|uniref:Replication protein A 70 kDa DNA-binding subunit B/D first OB fold domain-containing protein n=1 Tax=Solanum commersonii TaxID=4109 RepID=A0A9J5ZUF1_SOLCO|nr:hypothetical protein H5410_015444 [Solanum commersonii]
MATESELANQTVPINKIPKNSVDSVIRVLVIRRGSITPYKNSRHEGTYRTIILVDEEGIKIQATLFNKQIETWKDFLKPNKSYYIAKGRYDRVNPNYSSVHKEVELAFTDNTVITETDHEVSTQKFSDGFLSLDAADNLPNGSILDLICVLVSVNPIIQNATSKRREIVVTNELMEPTIVTLWGDFAENDGAFLDKLKDDKPILGLCDVRVSIYKGRFGISTIPVSSVLINPIFQKAIDLRACREIIEANNKDITVAPTKAMRRAIEVPLDHILDGLLPESQDSMYKFKATIVDILNKDEPWYFSCKTCRKKVRVIEEAATCANCNIDNVEYAMRSLIAEEIHQLEDQAPVILEEEVRSVRKYRKRAKKTTNAAAQINQKKPKVAKD